MNPPRASVPYGLGLALVVGALLRFWALSHGVPFALGVDEPEVMERAVRMMRTGDFNPHFFDYPSLYMYIEAAVSTLRFLTGATQGKWAALAQAPTGAFYFWGRATTAIIGTSTIWVVYRAGLHWGERTALLAAATFAVMPLHVRESHYTLTDVPATFFVTATFVLTLRASEQRTVGAFAIAGAVAGLAGATKYNAILAVLIPILSALLTPACGQSRGASVLAVLLGTVAAFLVAAPYTLLDLPGFLNGFARLASEYRAPTVLKEPIWIVYLKHLRNALSWPGSILVLVGVGLGTVRAATGPARTKWVLAVAFPLIYFYFVSHQSIVFARYLLPLLPFLSLLGAAAVVWMVDMMRRMQSPAFVRRVATFGLTLLSIVPQAYTAIGFDANEASVWTNDQLYDWVLRQLPTDAPIRFECSGAIHLPPQYKASYVKYLWMDRPGFYRTAGIKYLVTSSQCAAEVLQHPGDYPDQYAAYQRIFSEAEEVARFNPGPGHPGPELRVLRVK